MDCPKYRRNFVTTLTVNFRQYVIKNFNVPDTIRDTIKYSKYNSDDNLVFIRIDRVGLK